MFHYRSFFFIVALLAYLAVAAPLKGQNALIVVEANPSQVVVMQPILLTPQSEANAGETLAEAPPPLWALKAEADAISHNLSSTHGRSSDSTPSQIQNPGEVQSRRGMRTARRRHP